MTDFPMHSFTTKEVPAMTSDRASPPTDTSKAAIAAVVERLQAVVTIARVSDLPCEAAPLIHALEARAGAAEALISALEAERDKALEQVNALADAYERSDIAAAKDFAVITARAEAAEARAEKAEAERDEARIGLVLQTDNLRAANEQHSADMAEMDMDRLAARKRAEAAEARIATLQAKLEKAAEALSKVDLFLNAVVVAGTTISEGHDGNHSSYSPLALAAKTLQAQLPDRTTLSTLREASNEPT